MSFNHLCMGCMSDKGDQETCPYCGYREGTPPDSPQHLLPRNILNGRYLVGRVLGYGGFGVTYLAWDLNLNIQLAIKEYFPRDFATRITDRLTVSAYSKDMQEQYQYGLEKFLGEARALAQFQEHPNIVMVRDYFRENGTAYFVMNYIEGINFKQYLEQKGGKITFEEAMQIMAPVMEALREIHNKGLVHRDISPDNIYITKSGQIKVLDFGATRYAVGDRSISLSVIIKPGYAPEEQYRSKGKQGTWTDVYAVGATLYRAITGMAPPEAYERIKEDDIISPCGLNTELPQEAEKAIMKALSVGSENRYQTIEEFQISLTMGKNVCENNKKILEYDGPLKVKKDRVSKDIKKENLIKNVYEDNSKKEIDGSVDNLTFKVSKPILALGVLIIGLFIVFMSFTKENQPTMSTRTQDFTPVDDKNNSGVISVDTVPSQDDQVPVYFNKVKSIDAGYIYTVALKEDGTVVAWGYNVYGQCDVPAGLNKVKAIAAGGIHIAALKEDGTVVAWGDNEYGQCNVPAGLNGVKAITAGCSHTAALKEDGTVVAWGDNRYGRCDVPAGLNEVKAIAAGYNHSVALKEDGTVVAWGDNEGGECNVPAGLNGVIAIAAGGNSSIFGGGYTLALKEDGTVVAWGDNDDGQCDVPAGLNGVIAIAAGVNHAVALKEDGKLVAWGDNDDGQCNVPADLNRVKAIAAGHHTVALAEEGTVVAWGDNSYDQCNVP